MNILDAEIIEILSVSYEKERWVVRYKYNVWGSIRERVEFFKYREDAEKLKVGTIIQV